MPTELDLDAAVEASERTISTSVDDETVLLDLDTDVYYSVNPVGAELWERVQEPIRVRELRDVLVSEYDLSSDRAEADVVGFVNSLAAEDLLEVSDG